MAIQTQQETVAINNNSRTSFKRKTQKSRKSLQPPSPPDDDAGGAIILRSPENHVRKVYRCADSIRNYEPGFRFVPKDEELIDYLVKKLGKEEIKIEIHDVNLYKYNPEVLAENHTHLGEFEWYFFTSRDRKYRNGSRPSRSAGTGYWKATGADKKITLDTDTPNERIIGYRKALVFYQGSPPSGEKTNWIMHEFRLEGPPRVRENLEDMKLDDFVLCKIYEKPEKKATSDQTSDQDVSPEEPDNHTPTSTLEICNDEQLSQVAVNIEQKVEDISYESILQLVTEHPPENLSTLLNTPSVSTVTNTQYNPPPPQPQYNPHPHIYPHLYSQPQYNPHQPRYVSYTAGCPLMLEEWLEMKRPFFDPYHK